MTEVTGEFACWALAGVSTTGKTVVVAGINVGSKVTDRVTGKLGGKVTDKVSSVGEYIREQRRGAQYSLRQLAEAAGVSNPYLSQIERGVKKPSAEILQQIAKALRISAETLYVRAGILDERHASSDVVAAILADTAIGERHKRVLLDIYESFRREHVAEQPAQARPSNARRKRT